MDTIARTDPPYTADEVTTLRSFVDFYRATLRRQCAGLTAEELRTTLPPSTMTLGGLLKHLAWVEQFWFGEILHGQDPAEPWASAPWDTDGDWEWTSAQHDAPEDLDALFVASVTAADRNLDAALADGGLDTTAVRERHGEPVSVRWILVHMVEEYSRHAGHADLLRESLDGATDL
ncbi:DinB family protein [Antribacter sp. KLBMP9083]|uniref:DinB family protein n=1 Tax=Antribacter soli TaxID=2910976 RepID=A0AA41QC47_9MICO|nr:DinB family protein [Antribacter soli]MCF4120730.1 DinB family protein [Antribacter soli]